MESKPKALIYYGDDMPLGYKDFNIQRSPLKKNFGVLISLIPWYLGYR